MILDIETTGLSPKYTQVILVGFIHFTNNKWILTQIFCKNRSEEKMLLLELIRHFKNYNKILITYNGHSFDIPYLNERLKRNNINYQFDTFMNFDLYRVVRSSKKSLGLDNYKLKTIEKFLGITREDTISGKESVELYNLYEQNQDLELKKKILLHNYEDIEFLIPTLKILEYIPTSIIDKFYPFILKDENESIIQVLEYEILSSYIRIKLKINSDFSSKDYYNENYNIKIIQLDNNSSSIEITAPIFTIKADETYSFLDIDNLDFIDNKFNDLSLEDQLYYSISSKSSVIYMLYNIFKNKI